MYGSGSRSFNIPNNLVVQQKVTLLEAICPMCEEANKYETYDAESGQLIFTAEEDSGFCCRCCCNPNHELLLKISPAQGAHEVTIHRPFKCMHFFPACCDPCQQEMTLYEGAFDRENIGGKVIGTAKEPCCGGITRPKVEVFAGESDTAFATVEGPQCCFGGATEMCCDQTFEYSYAAGSSGSEIVRQRPDDLKTAMTSLFTDSDVFTMSIPNEMDQDQRATMLATLFLLDYMYFENDRWWSCEDGGCKITCCFMYCCGATLPFKVKLGGKKDGGGD